MYAHAFLGVCVCLYVGYIHALYKYVYVYKITP